ncbi:hypothetical protein [Janibacter sp. GXQ6167]|uniref:hypothetical protein n=1 Tax=Janibacter sp. GXQ6167 TaxID=3240791 RepID=UPI0035249E24
MEPSELLKKAWAAVEEAGLPEPLHEKAFEVAVSLLDANTPISSHGEPAHAPSASSPPATHSGAASGGGSAGGEVLQKISHESGISEADLERVLHFDEEGNPHVTGPARKLGSSTATQARTVALLLTAAWSLGLDSQQVPAKTIRDECARLKCFDQGNFGKHTGSTPGLTTVGDGVSRSFKLRPGDAGLKALSETIAGVLAEKPES